MVLDEGLTQGLHLLHRRGGDGREGAQAARHDAHRAQRRVRDFRGLQAVDAWQDLYSQMGQKGHAYLLFHQRDNGRHPLAFRAHVPGLWAPRPRTVLMDKPGTP